MAAAKSAHAHGFIKRLPKGYDTVISEDGGNLSQGQKQLLCIARVMLIDPPMLILDEATSSIDTRTEIRIQKAFDKMMEGRTSFIVAHRLSTIQEADRDSGDERTAASSSRGRHEELLAKRAAFTQSSTTASSPRPSESGWRKNAAVAATRGRNPGRNCPGFPFFAGFACLRALRNPAVKGSTCLGMYFTPCLSVPASCAATPPAFGEIRPIDAQLPTPFPRGDPHLPERVFFQHVAARRLLTRKARNARYHIVRISLGGKASGAGGKTALL